MYCRLCAVEPLSLPVAQARLKPPPCMIATMRQSRQPCSSSKSGCGLKKHWQFGKRKGLRVIFIIPKNKMEEECGEFKARILFSYDRCPLDIAAASSVWIVYALNV